MSSLTFSSPYPLASCRLPSCCLIAASQSSVTFLSRFELRGMFFACFRRRIPWCERHNLNRRASSFPFFVCVRNTRPTHTSNETTNDGSILTARRHCPCGHLTHRRASSYDALSPPAILPLSHRITENRASRVSRRTETGQSRTTLQNSKSLSP